MSAVRGRLHVAAGLVAVTALGWAYLLYLSSQHMGQGWASLAMAPARPWSKPHLIALFLMWAVMMAAMMLPSASRMILTYIALAGRHSRGPAPAALASTFTAGYLILWTAFSAAAALAQWGLYGAALVTPMGRLLSPWLVGAVLIAAGIYQWTPWKHACLTQCRSPFAFLVTRWRASAGGALRLGMDHGAYCVGCCAGLMALLFVAGTMNLLFVLAIAAFVLIEKLFPAGAIVARTGGAALIAAGIAFILL